MDTSPYKDDLPFNTITKIRNILFSAGIFTTEKYWLNNLNKFYSCRVNLKGTEFGTNGKGLNEEYSLASAYGEFMERIQNFLLFPRVEFPLEVERLYGFKFDPKEKKLLLHQVELPIYFEDGKPFYDGSTLMDFWNEYKINRPYSQSVLTLPYHDIINGKTEYLPYHFISYVYRSNGMAAGNTQEESLVQAIAEILERYVQKKIYFEELTPPDIPENYLSENSPKQYKLLSMIENAGDYKVIVKDCSLGIGLPVLSVILIDVKSNKYTIKFGSEPNPNIAIERCLTELLQGADITQINKLTEFRLDEFEINTDPDNFRTMMTIGKGRLPNSFFNSKPTYVFKGFTENNFSQIRDKLLYSIDILKSIGARAIYIKESAILDFPSHHVVVPGISEAFHFNEKSKQLFLNPVDVLKMMKNLPTLTDADLKFFAMDLENFRMPQDQKNNYALTDYFPLPVKNNTEWNKITLELLLSIIYYKIADYKKAHKNISLYIDFIRSRFKNVNLVYYYCVRELFSLLSNKVSIENSKTVLEKMYGQKIFAMVYEDLSDKSKVFRYIPLPNCWGCEKCKLSENCEYDLIKKTYLSIKNYVKTKKAKDYKVHELFLTQT